MTKSIKQLAKDNREFLEEKRREWIQEDPRRKTTKRAFAAWLGVAEYTYSNMTADTPTPPSRRTARRIAKRYPEYYDAIQRSEWRDQPVEAQDARLDQIADMFARLPQEDREMFLAKLRQRAGKDDGQSNFFRTLVVE